MTQHILLVEEYTPIESRIIVEASTCAKQVHIQGIFAQADLRNRNNRIYPLSEMFQAISRANEEISREGGIYGELDHPAGATVNLKEVSHIITSLRVEGTNVIGRATILPTPNGEIAKALFQCGRRPGISTRGGGKLNESGIVSDFTFITADLVATPSAQGAMPVPIYESLQQTAQGRHVMTLAESIKDDPKAQAYLVKELKAFMDSFIRK
jgi:hypothetical protein